MSELAAQPPYRRRETVATVEAGETSFSSAPPSGGCGIAEVRNNDVVQDIAQANAAVGRLVGRVPCVRDVMTPRPTCAAPQASVLQIVRMLHAKKFRHLPVTTDDRRLLGIISDRDVVRCFGPGEYPDEAILASIRVEQIMSTDVVTVGADESPVRAIELIREWGINALPVVEGDQLVGICTTIDLLGLLADILAGDAR